MKFITIRFCIFTDMFLILTVILEMFFGVYCLLILKANDFFHGHHSIILVSALGM